MKRRLLALLSVLLLAASAALPPAATPTPTAFPASSAAWARAASTASDPLPEDRFRYNAGRGPCR